MSFPRRLTATGIVIASDWRRSWLIIYHIMVVITSMVSCRGLTHYCTNVEKRLCHAVTCHGMTQPFFNVRTVVGLTTASSLFIKAFSGYRERDLGMTPYL
ncbi:hypothetical protein [Rickettsia endosymbiont of Orchestes rusci]|uniref:hypothetical protein n=1 Tax=Rickettsia endosymbiont of Orchestes rusci TaxID=3066250 RepID=UPI00313BFEE2